MEKDNKTIKPNLDLEVKVEVKGVQELENNLTDVKEMALALKEYYSKEKFIKDGTKLDFDNEEQMKVIEEKRKDAKDEKAKVNKFKDSINSKFKEAMEIYNQPIEISLKLKKETIDILTETYNFINQQVDLVDKQLLDEKIKQFKQYFEELAVKETIDFITYNDMKQNVTLSASAKSLKAEINNFIDKIKEELTLIDNEEHKAEILVEYKKTLNVANAINTVKDRVKAIEEAKKVQEERQQKIQEEQQQVQKVEQVIVQSKVKEVKVVETATIKKEESTIPVTTLTIKNETIERLQEIIIFLEEGGYDFE